MVEVFKTNVCEPYQCNILVRCLHSYFPEHRINFDLEDCDKILRVEGADIIPEKIIEIVRGYGYSCLILEG